jgi:hypothetical protein
MAIQPREENPATLVIGTSGSAYSRDRYEVDGPGRRCCRTRPGSFCLAILRLASLLLDEREYLVRQLSGLVEPLPIPYSRERAVGELD